MNNHNNAPVKRGLYYRAFFRNPVLVEAVGLSSVAAIADSSESALYLAVVTMGLLIITEALTSLFLKRLPAWIRIGIYLLIGTLVVTPFVVIVQKVSSLSLNLFLPLAAVNSIIVLHCERAAIRHNLKGALRDAFAASFGYGVVAILTGIIREFLGAGTVFGIDTGAKINLTGMLMPFGGFLVLGFLAAALSRNLNKIYEGRKSENSFDMSAVEDTTVFALMIANAKYILAQILGLKSNKRNKPIKKKPKAAPVKRAKPDKEGAAAAAGMGAAAGASHEADENAQGGTQADTLSQTEEGKGIEASGTKLEDERQTRPASTLPIVMSQARANTESNVSLDFDEILKELSEFNARRNSDKTEDDKTGGE